MRRGRKKKAWEMRRENEMRRDGKMSEKMPERKRETSQDGARYLRHRMLAQVGEDGQKKLEESRVLIVGAGGLGSPAALYLAAAGVGTIGLADFDRVDVSNLQRQILYTELDVGRKKTEAASARLRERNGAVRVLTYEDGLTEENAREIIGKYDVVIDACDNFPTRYRISDVCMELGKPDVYGAICEFMGQVTVFAPGGPCLRCLSPEDPAAAPDARAFGVLGAVPGVIGRLQAVEAMKWILGTGGSLKGRMLFLDLLSMRADEIEIPVNPRCSRHGTGNS